jgi:hypothetical protein
LSSDFHKISRVSSLFGATKWYLSDDCLLAAKRTMYVVEYRRFYLHDLESIVIWPNRLWLLRLIPGALIAVLGISLRLWVDPTAGVIFSGIALARITLVLALGPTAKARVCTTGATVDLPLVKRTRQAKKVLAKIDAAVRASREAAMQSAVASPDLQPVGVSLQTNSEAAASSIVDAS